MGTDVFRLIRLPLSIPLQQYTVFTFVFMLPLSEGREGEACKPSNEARIFKKSKALEGKMCSFFQTTIEFISLPIT
jgi:hypothetical protein